MNVAEIAAVAGTVTEPVAVALNDEASELAAGRNDVPAALAENDVTSVPLDDTATDPTPAALNDD